MGWKLEKQPIINSLKFIFSSTYCTKYLGVLKIRAETKAYFNDLERCLASLLAVFKRQVTIIPPFSPFYHDWHLVWYNLQKDLGFCQPAAPMEPKVHYILSVYSPWVCFFFLGVLFSVLISRSLKNIQHVEIKLLLITYLYGRTTNAAQRQYNRLVWKAHFKHLARTKAAFEADRNVLLCGVLHCLQTAQNCTFAHVTVLWRPTLHLGFLS